MIKSFAHKGLEQFFRTGSKAGIQPQHASRIRLILAQLQQARTIEDMRIPVLAKGPGIRVGYKLESQVSILDVAPSILQILAPTVGSQENGINIQFKARSNKE